MKWIITGGLGFVGSVTSARLLELGETVIIYARKSKQSRLRYLKLRRINKGNLQVVWSTRRGFGELLNHINADDVILHLANRRGMLESILDPAPFWEDNVSGLLQLLNVCREKKCTRIVYASSCAIYLPKYQEGINENDPVKARNPFSNTKLTSENVLSDFSKYGISSISLRYFNVRGADINHDLFDRIDYENDIFAKIFVSISKGSEFELFSDEIDKKFPSPFLRDYIHVLDVAEANILAGRYLIDNEITTQLNVGSGVGTSGGQLVGLLADLYSIKVKIKDIGMYGGIPNHLVANLDKITSILDWCPTIQTEQMLLDYGYQFPLNEKSISNC